MKKFLIFLSICILFGVSYFLLTQNVFVYKITANGLLLENEYNGASFVNLLEEYFESLASLKCIDVEKLDLKESISFFFDSSSLFVEEAFEGKVSENLFFIGSSISAMNLILIPALFFAFLDIFFKKMNVFTILKAILGAVMLVGVGIMIYSIIVLPEYTKSIIEGSKLMGITVENYEIKFTLYAYLVILTRLLALVLLIIPVKKAKAK